MTSLNGGGSEGIEGLANYQRQVCALYSEGACKHQNLWLSHCKERAMGRYLSVHPQNVQFQNVRNVRFSLRPSLQNLRFTKCPASKRPVLKCP
jgi:hypothetical protein